MDTFAHGAFGLLIFSRSGIWRRYFTERRWWRDSTLYWAIFFGMLPDLCSFGIYTVQRFCQGRLILGKPEMADIPAYVHINYACGHSLVIAAAIGITLWYANRKLFLPFLAWPFHILCDIPMHEKAFFSTPILFPFSSWSFDGWSFATYRWIIVAYWLVIAGLFVIRSRRRPPETVGAK